MTASQTTVLSIDRGDAGLTYNTTTGDWQWDVGATGTLIPGTYNIRIAVRDVAGNITVVTNPQKLVVDACANRNGDIASVFIGVSNHSWYRQR